jgi:hypothetical protein
MLPMRSIFFPFFRLNRFESLVQKSVKKALKESRLSVQPESFPLTKPKVIRSIRGLAILIGCSKSTAHRIKASGKIPYFQIGRKLIFNSVEVLNAIAQGNHKKATL